MGNKSEAVLAAEEALRVAKANLEFAKASPKQKRIIIANDVIAAIKAKSVIAAQVGYGKPAERDEDEALLAAKSNGCKACGIGTMFICGLRRGLSGDWDETDGQTRIHNSMSPFFSEDQLFLIEAAFEQDATFHPDNSSKAVRAKKFGDLYGDSNKRLVAIMKNIIDNYGVFRP